MTGINIATNLFVISIVIVIVEISLSNGSISNRRLCYDPKCSEKISLASTLMAYGSNDPGIMSFKSNVEATVYSKSAGNRLDLWGVEIDGKRGYVPKSMLREKEVYRKKLLHEVSTESVAHYHSHDDPKNPDANDAESVPKESSEDSPKKLIVESAEKTDANTQAAESSTTHQVSPSYEIHDGTTIQFAQNEEATERSYATQTPDGVKMSVDQQPILSIHPSIASSFAYETNRARKNQPSNENIVNEATTELPKVSSTSDAAGSIAESTTETNSIERTDEESVEATTAKIVQPDSGSAVRETSEEMKGENSETKNSTVEVIDDTTKLKSNDSAEKLDDEVSEKIENEASKDIPASDKIQKMDVETQTEPTTTKSPADDSKTDEIITDPNNSNSPTDDNNNISKNETVDAIANVPAVSDDETVSDEKIENAEETEDDGSDDDESGEEVDDDDDDDDPEVDDNEQPAENDSPIKNQDPTTEKPMESHPPEETAPPAAPQNIMSPLFSRLSAIPEAVKEMVAKTMSSGNSDEQSIDKVESPIIDDTKDSKIDEVTKINEATSSSPIFSNDNHKINDSANETDSKTIESQSDNETTDKEAKNDDKNDKQFVNNDSIEIETNENNDDSKLMENPSQNHSTNVKTKNIDNEIVNNNIVINETEDDVDDTKTMEIGSVNDETKREEENVTVNDENVKIAINDNVAKVETKKIGESIVNDTEQPGIYEEDVITGSGSDDSPIKLSSSFNGFPANRNLLNVGNDRRDDDREDDSRRINEIIVDEAPKPIVNDVERMEISISSEIFENLEQTEMRKAESETETNVDALINDEVTENKAEIGTANDSDVEEVIAATETIDSCEIDGSCAKPEDDEERHHFFHQGTDEERLDEDAIITESFSTVRNYWQTFACVVLTAFTTLIFSLGYYYIENKRRDGELIARINVLEKELLVASKECTVLDDTLKSTKTKLDSIEDESFGSNEMVVSLKADLEASQSAKSELEEQVTMLEKELETATEAGLELERMLREILSTNNQDNPLAQSIEDLQTRLNAQQAANEALTNALNLKAQENESLTSDLAATTRKCEQLEVEVTRLTEELKHENNAKSNLEQNLLDKLAKLENQVKDISGERSALRKQLKSKEMELKDVMDVVNQMNVNNLDFEKLYNVSRVKAEADQLMEERDELQMRLSEVEGAHQLLEEHAKLINEEVSSLSEQCKLAEKAKRDAETRVEVLSNFFKEKEAQRQKEEAVWLQKQGEVSSTVERLHTMQNEIHNYKQQIEMLKREILDQEREYKNQIANLETKTHEHWVIARQNERRLEESKAEAGQLRNRLTLIEKNLNDTDPEAKLHRLESNGDAATSPQLFIGAEASSSPIMFTGSSGVPFPPPSSYRYCPPPPFMPPPTYAPPGISPYDVGQRPPPLGGRLSSPPPPPLAPSSTGRYDDRHRSPPPPLSPSVLPPYGPMHRPFPPPFTNDRIHHPPPPSSHTSMLPPPPPPPLGPSAHSWTNESVPHNRNSGFRPHHQQQRDQQRSRNHKGSLHSSGESLDKTV